MQTQDQRAYQRTLAPHGTLTKLLFTISTGISVVDVLIEVIVGEIVVNNTAGTRSFFGTSVGQQRFKRRGHGIQFTGVE